MKIICAFLLVLVVQSAFAQNNQLIKNPKPDWVNIMYSENPNLFELRDAYESFYKTHEFVKNNTTQYYKRFIRENWLKLDQDGFIVHAERDFAAEEIYLQKKKANEALKSSTSAWQEIGPWQYDHEQAMAFNVQSPGSAHVYTVDQSLSNDQLVYAGTANAGLWKSLNKGLSWSLMTQNLMVNSVYSIAIDPINNDIVYFGEENGAIWKTTDAGLNWTKTGDIPFQATSRFVRDLKIVGVNTLLAATNGGLFRSTDAGLNWVNVHVGEHMEIEIKPNDPNTLYSVKLTGDKTEFYKSLDNGLTWVVKPIGWPDPAVGDEQKRTEISVSAADPNRIYVWSSGIVGVDEGFYAYYKSYDAGETFVLECCDGAAGGPPTVTNPNFLGWSEDGTGDGGQYYYDLAHGASPTDVNRVYGSGINVWRSDNGGTDWSLNAHWVTWVGTHTPYRYTHADVHDIKFFSHGATVDMWVCSDGGIFYSDDEGDTIVPRMHGIHGTDFWGYQSGFKQGNIMVGGTYHNGTLIKYNDIYHGGLTTPLSNGWLAEKGGDNFRGFVNYGKKDIAYADNGSFKFSTVRETRISDRAFDDNNICNTSYVYGEYGNYGFSPLNYNQFYSPVDAKLMKTENGGVSFTQVADFGTGAIIQVKVAWSNPSIIYITHKVSASLVMIKKSIDYGVTWTSINPAQSITGNNSSRSKYIEVDDKDPNKLWVILMGSQVGNKVFKSIDGGVNWVNNTSPILNAERVISILHHYGTDDGLYIGTTNAIYYKNNAMTDWALFNNNLPASTSSVFLEPYYGMGKLRSATQRSVYECDFYENAPPVAMPSADKDSLNLSTNCIGDTVFFVDHSTLRVASGTWKWTFEGGVPAFSTEENPRVVYNTVGNFDVKLVVTDAFGSDSVTIMDMISVTNQYSSASILETFNGVDFPPVGWNLYDNQGVSWEQDWPQNDVANKCASFPNYWENAEGQQHYLILPGMSFTGATNTSITFDYSFSSNNGNYIDTLELIYRTGTNPNWQRLWAKGGDDLNINGLSTYFWDNANPTMSWVNAYVDLSLLNNPSCLELAFSNIGKHGNHIWLDNVNISGAFLGVNNESKIANMVVYPNPSSGKYKISNTSEDPQFVVYNSIGKMILSGKGKLVDLAQEASGIYFLNVNMNGVIQSFKLIKE
jgi:PKD repeat protein